MTSSRRSTDRVVSRTGTSAITSPCTVFRLSCAAHRDLRPSPDLLRGRSHPSTAHVAESLTRLRAPPPTARRLSHHSLLRSLWHALHWRRSPGFPLCAVTLTARGSVKSCPCAQVVFGGSLTPYASALVVIVSPGYQRQRHGMMASWPS